MSTNHKISAETVLNSLGSLSDKAAYLSSLDRAVKALLSSELAAHCQVANVRDNVLILHLDAAEWATQLHYQLGDLLNQLRQQTGYAGLRTVQYKIRPAEGEKKIIAKVPAKPLSNATRKLLSEMANSMENKELAEALSRLSKR
jgi:hypothetical protein